MRKGSERPRNPLSTMERTLFLAATFWTGSVGALAVSAGYLGAQHLSGRRAALPEPRAGEVVWRAIKDVR